MFDCFGSAGDSATGVAGRGRERLAAIMNPLQPIVDLRSRESTVSGEVEKVVLLHVELRQFPACLVSQSVRRGSDLGDGCADLTSDHLRQGEWEGDRVVVLDECVLHSVTTITQRSYNIAKAITTNTYNGYHTLTSTPEGRKARTATDVFGNATKIERLKLDSTVYSTTNYTFDRTDNIRTIANAGDTTTYTYNALGQRTQADDPNAGVTAYTYGPDGELVTTTDATGATIRNEYDELGRVTTRHDGPTASDPVLSLQVYWEAGDTPSNQKGLLKGTISIDGATIHGMAMNSYDVMGRVTSTTETLAGAVDTGLAGSYTTTQTYNAAGQSLITGLPAVADLPAETINRTYTNLGLPATTIGQIAGEPDTTYLSGSSYRSDGKLTGHNSGTGANVIQRTYSYDTLNRLERAATGNDFNQISYIDETLSYDKDGNVIQIVDATDDNQSQCFKYDHQSRLGAAWTSDTCGDAGNYASWDPSSANGTYGSEPYRQIFDYDNKERLTTVTSGGLTPSVKTYAYAETGNAGPHAATSISESSATTTMTYNARGDILTRNDGSATTTHVWDSRSRLREVQGAGVSTVNRYNDAGDRILRTTTTAAGTSTVAYIANHEITKSTSGGISANRSYDNAVRSSSGLSWLVSDRQGSAQAMIDAADPTQYSLQRYLPYGAPRGGTLLPPDKNFLGKPLDAANGYLKLGARHYDPEDALFLTPDPLLSPGEAKTLNPYSYAGGNPATYSDPSGLSWLPNVFRAIFKVISFAIKTVQRQRVNAFRSAVGRVSWDKRQSIAIQRANTAQAIAGIARERQKAAEQPAAEQPYTKLGFEDAQDMIANFEPNLTAACGGGNAGFGAMFSAQGCFAQDGNKLGLIITKSAGAGIAASADAGILVSNAEDIGQLAGESACGNLSVASATGEICFGLDEDRNVNGVVTIYGGASVGPDESKVVPKIITRGGVPSLTISHTNVVEILDAPCVGSWKVSTFNLGFTKLEGPKVPSYGCG